MTVSETVNNMIPIIKSTKFYQYLASGQVTNEIYSYYLHNLLKIHTDMEIESAKRGLFIAGLDRAYSIGKDIDSLNVDPHHPISTIVMSLSAAMMAMTDDQFKINMYCQYIILLTDNGELSSKVPGDTLMYQFSDIPGFKNELESRLDQNLTQDASNIMNFLFALYQDLSYTYNIP